MQTFPLELRHPSGAVMRLDPVRLLLAFREPTDLDRAQQLIEPFGLELEPDADQEQRPHAASVNHTPQRIWVRNRKQQPFDEETYRHLRAHMGDLLEWAGPVYRLTDTNTHREGLVCPLPNVLLIRTAEDIRQPVRRSAGMREVKEKSAYLGPYRYFELAEPSERNAYEVQRQLTEQGIDAVFEHMPLLVPLAVVPNDPLFPQQWAMTQIRAGGPGTTGWDLGTGSAGVVVAIIDTGVDLGHPDLVYAGTGINLGSMAGDGRPASGGSNIGHGTCCAGLAVGRYNSAAGIAGVAGTSTVLPVAFQNWTDAEVAAGINWAAANGASVLSMSFGQYAPGEGFGPTGWNFAVIDPAILNAVNVRGCVLIAATGNENTGTVNRYPARHNLVMAVGGSDQADNRKSPSSPDGESWGANFGPGISVAAPAVRNPSTDMQGAGGYDAGDYFTTFNGTSSATPLVAGLAAAARSRFPGLSNLEVRRLIERTADKVGGSYADVAGFPHGTRTAQLGYGRVNMYRALDQADVMIRDWYGDTGAEPSSPPANNFWSFSDIVVRIFDDDVFVPGDPSQASNVERGQTNHIYVRVTNTGAGEARNVTVQTRITPYVGLEFLYPVDWTTVDATHVQPAPLGASFATVAAGTSVIAKFSVSAAQTETLWGWVSGMSWHPCLLAVVQADNDYAFAGTSGANLQVLRNNLAQRNLSVINVLASTSAVFPFLAAHLHNAERSMKIRIDRGRLPQGMPVMLDLEHDGAQTFPQVTFGGGTGLPASGEGLLFLDRTHIETRFGCCRGVLTLEKGSRFDCSPPHRLKILNTQGGNVVVKDGRELFEVRDEVAFVEVAKEPHRLYPMALHTTIPVEAHAGETFELQVAQLNASGRTVGGAGMVYRVQSS